MQGFPPPPDARVTLANWQVPPFVRWSFHHVREVVPTARVSRGAGPHRPFEQDRADVAATVLTRPDSTSTTVGQVMASTHTDGWLVLRDGRVLTENYPAGVPADRTHLLMSVTKSLVGVVAGILIDRGTLDEHATVGAIIPEMAGSGYGEATVRHLLDMRSGIVFSEDYLDPRAEVRLLEQVVGWSPRTDPALPYAMYDFLALLRRDGEHGGAFSYRSCETDMLGWVCERVADARMPDLLSRLLWSRLGVEQDADFAVDAAGAAFHDGGLCTTLRDLARFGQLLLDEGKAADGQQVVPAWWIQDSYAGAPDSREAFAPTVPETLMPGGMYRNQFWLPYPDRELLLCLGIHGQMVYVNPAARVVAVKLSSWDTPQNPSMLAATLAAFDAVAAAVAS